MNRRNFINKTSLALIGFGAFLKEGLAQTKQSTAKALVWLKEGVLSYKAKAPKDKALASKICLNCKWYEDDTKHEFGGKCNLKAVTSAMKSNEVYVHSAGNCNMWQKR